MKKLLFSLYGCLFLTGTLSALLPPLYQNIAELKAILSDDKISECLQSGDVIEEIRKTNEGYLIVTNHREVLAEVVYQPAENIGPAKFKIIFKGKTSNPK